MYCIITVLVINILCAQKRLIGLNCPFDCLESLALKTNVLEESTVMVQLFRFLRLRGELLP